MIYKITLVAVYGVVVAMLYKYGLGSVQVTNALLFLIFGVLCNQLSER